ncbi:MAG: ABC transporter substrate-binding protein [Anaerolineales bacterium]|nr:ABC transporter substrate-binding protein [Anaerolineales bacterium]
MLLKRFAWLFVVGMVIAGCAAPAAVAPAGQAAPDTAPATPNVLTVSSTANVTTWDPIKSFSTEAEYLANLYEPLLRINPPGAAERFSPVLAESWESDADGKTWTFKLRPNVKFHDGEPLTADAVKQSIEAAKDHAGASFIWAPLESVEAVDDLTVKFNLSYAAPLDLIASSLYGAWIVSPKALAAVAADENYFEAGVEAGTGPYMLESYTPDQEVLLTRFDDYWGNWQDGQFDKVLVKIVPEAVQQQQMLEGGEVDLALRLPAENYASFKDKPGYTLLTEPSFFNYVGFLNTLRPPLDNPKVRQAIAYAIPYQDIIDVATFGQATQARGPVPAGVWPYSEEVTQYATDLEKAKALMAEAGFADGGIDLRLTYAAENKTEERFAPVIKDALAEIGINVSIEPILFNQQWEEAKSDPANAQDMFLLLYWPTYSDAGTDNLYSMFHSSEAPFFNLSYWKNEEFDTLIDEAAMLTVTDPDASLEKYVKAQNLLVDEAPGIFFFDTKAPFVIPDHIGGFQYNLNYPFATFFYDLYRNPAQ